PNYGSPFVRDLDNGRRYGTIEDFRNFVKLAYLSPHLHHSGGTVCEPVDVPVNKRHLDMVYSHIRYSDKPFMGSVTAPERARDTVEMARITFGADYLEDHAVILSLINANSPLVWDGTMLGAARAYAEANQATLLTPFILAGAGWLEGGLAVGYEKFVMDADQCGMAAVFIKGIDLTENGQAVEAILENGPGQHFLGTAHTLANFETAFYRSEIADNNSFEQWQEDGSLDAAQRANGICKRMLREYEAPPLDEGIEEALTDLIAKRKASLPDP